jgi:hydrogenase/urease accessory protein HupE
VIGRPGEGGSRPPRLIVLALLAWLLGCPGLARAHDPGLSVLQLRLDGRQLHAHFIFARREIEPLVPIDADRDGSVTREEFAAARPRLLALAGEMLMLGGAGPAGASEIGGADRAGDPRIGTGPATAPEIAGVELDESDALHVRLSAPYPAGAGAILRVPIIGRLAVGHRQYASARDARGQLVAERVLDASRPLFPLEALSEPGATAGGLTAFHRFLVLGLEHILGGWDHLLFLLGLLIVAETAGQTVRIITSFTAAHSLTLAAATLGVLRLPASLVEPLIAASIVLVGLDNLRRRPLPHRWLLTFGFGLVHGLGFAGALAEVGLGATPGIVPLVAFNLGVEVGQLAVALPLLPLIRLARQRARAFPRLATASSLLLVAAGAWWLLERTLLA